MGHKWEGEGMEVASQGNDCANGGVLSSPNGKPFLIDLPSLSSSNATCLSVCRLGIQLKRGRARRAHFATTKVQSSFGLEGSHSGGAQSGHGLLVCKCDFASPSMPDIARPLSSLESCISGSGGGVYPNIHLDGANRIKGANDPQQTLRSCPTRRHSI